MAKRAHAGPFVRLGAALACSLAAAGAAAANDFSHVDLDAGARMRLSGALAAWPNGVEPLSDADENRSTSAHAAEQIDRGPTRRNSRFVGGMSSIAASGLIDACAATLGPGRRGGGSPVRRPARAARRA